MKSLRSLCMRPALRMITVFCIPPPADVSTVSRKKRVYALSLRSVAAWNILQAGICTSRLEDEAMRKSLTAVAAAATLAIAAVAAPPTAEARWGWRGGAFVGGLTAGALISSAFAGPYYGGYYPAAYPNPYPYPYYYGYFRPYPIYYRMYTPRYYGAYAYWPYYRCWRYGYRVC